MAISGGGAFSGSGGQYKAGAGIDEARAAAIERRLQRAGVGRERAKTIAGLVGSVVGGVAGGFATGGNPAGIMAGAGAGAGLASGAVSVAQGDPASGVPLILGGLASGGAVAAQYNEKESGSHFDELLKSGLLNPDSDLKASYASLSPGAKSYILSDPEAQRMIAQYRGMGASQPGWE